MPCTKLRHRTSPVDSSLAKGGMQNYLYLYCGRSVLVVGGPLAATLRSVACEMPGAVGWMPTAVR